MKQEDRELLLKDLGARLLYGVKVLDNSHKNYGVSKLINIGIDGSMLIDNEANDTQYYPIIDETKPYLRPMSSITEEEKKELKSLFDAEEVTRDSICYLEGGTLEEYLSHISYSFCSEIIDWLNAHHFDYRGLIEKGLALVAPDGMYE